MMASPNYAYQIYDGDGSVFGESGPPGSAEAEKEFQRFFTVEAKENYTTIEVSNHMILILLQPQVSRSFAPNITEDGNADPS